MTAPGPGNTLAYIRRKVRRLTASSSESSLTTDDIDTYINTVYENDFPYAIKIDQMRSVYKFLTIPNVDRYPVDVNTNQGFRSPVYVEGIQGNFFKNRDQLFNLYPRFPTQYQPIGGDGLTTTFNFTLFGNASPSFPQPRSGILSTQVVIGGVDINGDPIRVIDDGGAVVDANGIGSNTTTGQLIFLQQNNVGNNVYLDSTDQKFSVPPLSPLGGYPSNNNSYPEYPPAPLSNQYCGTVDYISTAISLTLPVAPAAGTMLNVWAAQYNVGRPYNVLFWNNEITVRPVPDNVYMIEIETFLTPVQFMESTDHPVLNQWSQYIAYLASQEILRDRQDFEGVQNLEEGKLRQEALVLERQAIEEIGQPNITMFNSTKIGYGVGYGSGQGYF